MTEKEYNALNESNKHAWGAVNFYLCPEGHITVTIDRDNGVTPFIIWCEHEDFLASAAKRGASRKCGREAQSAFYRVSESYASRATHEFYRPTFEYYQNIKSKALKEHIERGGLAFRKIGDSDCYQ
jgi:hypothetical protein